MAAAGVQIEGLREFRAALRAIDPQLARGLQEGLKDAAQIVAYETRRRAPRGPSGRTVSTTRAFASGTSAGVRTTARRVSPKYPGGYPYPRRLEFEKGGARAFMRPALEAKRAEVVRRIGYVLDDVGETWAG